MLCVDTIYNNIIMKISRFPEEVYCVRVRDTRKQVSRASNIHDATLDVLFINLTAPHVTNHTESLQHAYVTSFVNTSPLHLVLA